MPGCTPMSECLLTAPPGYTGSMVNRGLCVISGGKNECWDVCNPEHEPADYLVSATGGSDPGNSLYNHISQGMVGAVRDGLNNNVSCPPALQKGFATEICTPGSECTNKMRHKFNIQRGRGLCVVDSAADGARICMDMCNLNMDPSKYAQGSPAGTHIKVVEFRASGACQNNPTLIWLLAILGIALLLCCCAAGYYNIRKRQRKGSEAAMKDLDEEMLESTPENYGGDAYQQEPPQDQYGADPYAGHSTMVRMSMAPIRPAWTRSLTSSSSNRDSGQCLVEWKASVSSRQACQQRRRLQEVRCAPFLVLPNHTFRFLRCSRQAFWEHRRNQVCRGLPALEVFLPRWA